jgi:hypothetical protein
VRYGGREIVAADLGAPLLALAAGSIDGDRRDEVILLTTAEVVVVRLERAGAAIVARAPLSGPPPSLRPRDPVGVLELGPAGEGGRAIRARTSARADGVELALEGGRLVERARLGGFPLCGARAELVPGQGAFARDRIRWPSPREGTPRDTADGAPPRELPPRFLAAACEDGLVDPHGHPLRAHGAVEPSGRLVLGCARTEGACDGVVAGAVDGVGTAFAIVDLDRDGRPEVAHALAVPPGEPDEVRVLGGRGRTPATLHVEKFQGGVVGLAAADLAGDGVAQLIAAVRFVGSNQVTLWTLN